MPSPRRRVRRRARAVAARVTDLDQRLLAAAARTGSPRADRALTAVSTAADSGRLWLAVAAVLTATGRRRPRTAAASGLLGLGVASTLVNGPLKFVWRRDRPPASVLGARGPLLPLPLTYSFPSGHSASAAAFATGVSLSLPAAAPAVVPLAGAVAYSRAHTGVHYPSDVLVGSVLGAGAGVVAARVVARARASSLHYAEARPLPTGPHGRAVLLASGGSGSADGLEPALRALERAGVEVVERVDVGDAGSLPGRLRSLADEGALVIAAGGDGTVGAAAQAVTGMDAVLGILPLGTSNDIARSLGIPPDPVEAAALIAGGAVRAVDVGEYRLGGADPKRFVNAATAGLNVAFAELATTSRMRDRFGGLTYPVAAAAAIRRYEPFRCSIRHHGRELTLDVVHLSVSNATVFGGVLGMRVPGASMTDGLLDVIVVERLSLPRLAAAVGNTVIGRHTPVHHVHALQVSSIEVHADSGQQIAADGEVVGDLPATFTVRPAALHVLTPWRDGESRPS